jgi:O-antigen/teichoic acid export membrane protein
MDQLIIGVLMSPAMLSSYYLAKKLPGYIDIAMVTLGRPLMTRVAECRDCEIEKVRRLLTKISKYNSVIFVPLCCGCAVFGYAFLEVYGGMKYTESYPILVILCLAWIVKSLSTSVFENGLFVFATPSKTLMVDVVACVSNIVLLLVFVPLWQITGVAVATLLSIAITAAFACYHLRRLVAFDFDFSTLLRVGVATGGFVAVAASLQLLYYDLRIVPIYMVIALLVYFLITCNVIKEEDMILVDDVSVRSGKVFRSVIKAFRLGWLTRSACDRS